MEDKFKFGEGLEILLFLQKNLDAKVVYTGNNLVHLCSEKDIADGEIISFVEEVRRRYAKFFSAMNLCLLHELPTHDNSLKFTFHGLPWLSDKLAEEFGGFSVGNYWFLNDESRSYYGYKGEKLPTASEIVKFVESLLA